VIRICCPHCHTHCRTGGARFDDGAGGDNEVQRTMLEIVNQLDGFDARGNVKVCAPVVDAAQGMQAVRCMG